MEAKPPADRALLSRVQTEYGNVKELNVKVLGTIDFVFLRFSNLREPRGTVQGAGSLQAE